MSGIDWVDDLFFFFGKCLRQGKYPRQAHSDGPVVTRVENDLIGGMSNFPAKLCPAAYPNVAYLAALSEIAALPKCLPKVPSHLKKKARSLPT